mgnify:CR=1 FL=1
MGVWPPCASLKETWEVELGIAAVRELEGNLRGTHAVRELEGDLGGGTWGRRRGRA